jgi:hypothetical protein
MSPFTFPYGVVLFWLSIGADPDTVHFPSQLVGGRKLQRRNGAVAPALGEAQHTCVSVGTPKGLARNRRYASSGRSVFTIAA